MFRSRTLAFFVASFTASLGAALIGEQSASAQMSLAPAGIPVYNAATLTRGAPLAQSIRENTPDVLVVRNVPSFAALRRLRDTLGLRGYSAAMSNFACGSTQGQPLDVGVLSREPIEEAAEYDAPGTNCVIAGPFVAGPGVAVHVRQTISPRGWPHLTKMSDKPMPGSGILAVRISGESQPLVLARLPTANDYLVKNDAAVEKMRVALEGTLHGKAFAGCHARGCQIVTIDQDTSAAPGIRTAMR